MIFVKGEFSNMSSRDAMPLTAFLDQYEAAGTLRAHMPGHKGRTPEGLPDLPYRRDITEIAGADSLFEASGILLAVQETAGALYGTQVCMSAGGSTLCIQAMLARMRAEGRSVIAARTVHRSFLNACVLLGLPVTWVYPREGNVIAGTYALADFEEALRTVPHACVYVTSPDYTGHLQDIAGLSALCRRYGAVLLVDNAHGAHLHFLPESLHPMALGADHCCDSLHKTLPCLTGGALLHTARGDAALLRQDMMLFGSTSPSYVIMESVEHCITWLKAHGRAAMRESTERSAALRERLSGRYALAGEDPLHLTLRCDGEALAEDLRAQGVECEYADGQYLVLLLSPVMTPEEWARLEAVLRKAEPAPARPLPPLPPSPEQAMPMREAALCGWESAAVDDAVGRICGPVQVPCPPAVPVVMPGERLDGEWAGYLRALGVERMNVVR